MKKQHYLKKTQAALLTALTLSGMGGITTYSPSIEAKTVYCSNCATSSQGSRIASNTSRTNDLLRELHKKLEQTRKDIVNALGQSTAGVSTAVSQTGEISSNDRAEVDQFGEIMNAKRSRPDDINCGNVGSGSAPSGTTQRGSGGGGGSGGGSYSPPSNKFLAQAHQNTGITSTPPDINKIPSPEAQISILTVGGCATYAKKGSLRAQMCEQAELPIAGTPEFPEADVSGLTLLYGPQEKDDSGKTRRNSFDPESPEHKAMISSVVMLYNDKAAPTITKAGAQTTAGLNFIGLTTKWLAARELAAQIAKERVDSFIVEPKTLEALNEIKKDDSAFLSAYLKDIKGWEKGVSTSLMRDIEVDRRASNPEWTKRIHKMNEEARAVESLAILAQMLKMQRDQLEETEKTNLLLAKLLDASVNDIETEVNKARIRSLEETSVILSGGPDGESTP